MELSLSVLFALVVILLFLGAGLVLGGMVIFDITFYHFARFEFKTVVALIFLTIIVLGGLAIIVDLFIRP